MKSLRMAGARRAGDVDDLTKHHVLVPVAATEKVKITPEGEIEITDKTGISRIKKTVQYQNLDQWARDMGKQHARLDAMKSKGEYFAFKVEGHRSWQVFSTIGDLLRYIRKYSAFNSKRASQNEFFQSLEIVKIADPRAWAKAVDRKRFLLNERGGRRKHIEQSKRERAAWQRKFRASLTPAQREKYKRDAKSRAKKSRSKRK